MSPRESVDGEYAQYRTRLEDYAGKFEQHFKLTRRDGILLVQMHTSDGPVAYQPAMGMMVSPLVHAIDHDDDNEVLIWTGTGDSFIGEADQRGREAAGLFKSRMGEPELYRVMYRNVVRHMYDLANLSIPIISAVNGPVIAHPEYALLADLVICSPNASFYDSHWDRLNLPPGDGVHIIYRELLGRIRGRYFLLTGQTIGSNEALGLGLVSEIVPREQLLDRAWELAESVFMTRSRAQRRLTHALLAQPWRELIAKEIAFGMAHEALSRSIDPTTRL